MKHKVKGRMILMKKWFLAGCMVVLSIGLIPMTAVAAEEKVRIEIKEGPVGAVRPDLDTATVELAFSQVPNGSAHIRLRSPETKFFSPTDFPWVEGTELIDATLLIEGGKATFNYMFPIRGDYPMTVELFGENGQSLGIHQLVVSMQENPKEVQNAILFVVLLGSFGLLVGFGLSKWRGNLHAA
jgi:hypothetical protein